MKKILFLLILLKGICALSQNLADTGAIRAYNNTYVVANSARSVTATNLNVLFNGLLNVLPGDSLSVAQGTANDTLFFWRKKVKAFYILLRVGAGSSPGQYASLTDVTLTSLSDGQVIKWNASTNKWNNFTIDKGFVGLGNVENTALSTWAGSINITRLGTVISGIWNASPISDSYISSASNWNAKQSAITLGNTAQYFKGDLSLGTLNAVAVGLGNVQNVDQTNASNLTSGSVPSGRFGNSTIPISALNASGGTTSDFLKKDGTWATPSAGVTAYSALTDVALSSILNGQLAKWNSTTSKWNNFTPGFTDATGWLGYVPINPTGTSAQYFRGNGSLAVFPTDLSSFGNGPGYLSGTVGVTAGGSGNSSFNPYWLIAGGTSPTGPLQQISGTGTAGQVLVSNGSGALPSWQVGPTSSAYSSLSDVTLSSILGNQLVRWNSSTSKWNNFTPGISDITSWLGYIPMNPTGTTLQYWKGNGALGTFPTAVSFFINDMGYLKPIDSATLWVQWARLYNSLDSMRIVNDSRYRATLDTLYAHFLLTRAAAYKISDSLAGDYISRLTLKRDLLDTSYTHLLMTRAWGYKISDSLAAMIAQKLTIGDTAYAHFLMTRTWGYKISDSIFAVMNAALTLKLNSADTLNRYKYRNDSTGLGGFSTVGNRNKLGDSLSRSKVDKSDSSGTNSYLTRGTGQGKIDSVAAAKVDNYTGTAKFLGSGTFAGKPVATTGKGFWYATDSAFMLYSTGSAWVKITDPAGQAFNVYIRNRGSGVVLAAASDSQLFFKTIKAGTNVTFDLTDTNTIVINSAGGGGSPEDTTNLSHRIDSIAAKLNPILYVNDSAGLAGTDSLTYYDPINKVYHTKGNAALWGEYQLATGKVIHHGPDTSLMAPRHLVADTAAAIRAGYIPKIWPGDQTLTANGHTLNINSGSFSFLSAINQHLGLDGGQIFLSDNVFPAAAGGYQVLPFNRGTYLLGEDQTTKTLHITKDSLNLFDDVSTVFYKNGNAFIRGLTSVTQIGGSSSAPTFTTGPGVPLLGGGSPSISGNNLAGTFTVTTGTSGGSASTVIATITLSATQSSANFHVFLQSTDANILSVYANPISTTQFQIILKTGQSMAFSTTYSWNYLIIQ